MLLRSHVNIGQYGAECSHHLQASHLTSKAIKTTRATALEYILASGLDKPNERFSQNQTSHDSTRYVQTQMLRKTGSEKRDRKQATGCQSMKEKRREVAVIDELRAGGLWRPRELKRWTTVRRAFLKPTLKRLLILVLDGSRF